MGAILLVSVAILFLAALLALAFFWIKLMPPKRANMPLVENHCPWKTKGFSKGVLISKAVGRGGRFLISFRPTDIPDDDRIPVPDSVSLIVGPNNLDIHPKGAYSAYRDTLVVYPNGVHDVDQSIIGTNMGKDLLSRSSDADARNMMFATTKEQISRMKIISQGTAGGEATDAMLRTSKAVFDTLLERKKSAEKGTSILGGNLGK